MDIRFRDRFVIQDFICILPLNCQFKCCVDIISIFGLQVRFILRLMVGTIGSISVFIHETLRLSVVFGMVAVTLTYMSELWLSPEQSTVIGLLSMMISSGSSATLNCVVAVCVTDPLVNPHSYVPAGNIYANVNNMLQCKSVGCL